MMTRIQVGGIPVEVVFKRIKNVHLSVYPPNGRVRISAPVWISLDAVRLHAIAKMDWIRRQQTKLLAQHRETPREYLDRESHYLWGKRYLLKVIETASPPSVEIRHSQLKLTVRPGADKEKRSAVVLAWYREMLRIEAIPLIAKWEPVLGVKVNRLFVQRMKTRWGSCNPRKRTIRLNSELAKKPRECLEYVIVHELVHLLEPSHNQVFVSYMEKYMPAWSHYRDELNRAPLGYPEWGY